MAFEKSLTQHIDLDQFVVLFNTKSRRIFYRTHQYSWTCSQISLCYLLVYILVYLISNI